MQKLWIRLILLLVMVVIQTGCLCWRNCPPEAEMMRRAAYLPLSVRFTLLGTVLL